MKENVKEPTKFMVVDKATGYLDSQQYNGFKAKHKVKFLELLKDKPNISACINSLGFDRNTLMYHIKYDTKFGEAYKQVVAALSDTMAEYVYNNGKEPRGFMDRMAWLNAHDGDKWNTNKKITVKHDNNDLLQFLLKRAKSSEYKREAIDVDKV